MVNILHNTPRVDEDWCFGSFSKFIKPGDSVAVVAFSFRDAEIDGPARWREVYGRGTAFHGEITGAFAAYGIGQEAFEWVNYFEDTEDAAIQKLKNSSSLYFLGGLPDRMMERLREFGLGSAIRAHPGLVMGFSAGAMIQLDEYHISPDADYAAFSYGRGCGLLSGFGIEVHYDGNSEVQNACIQRVLREKQRPVYAMADDGALIIRDGSVVPIGNVRRVAAPQL